ncbi:hypothetical protein G9A89_001620 [Geosiphon pyriformis]|nr:hypothetical protein G9A89_001620 [Geosiphon pyriformis]
MDKQFPNSLIVDDDNFEFVDYVASSYWERFITTVEEVLTGWGLNEGKLGIFDEKDLRSFRPIDGVVNPFVQREIIILDENSYTLSYHYHPIEYDERFQLEKASSADDLLLNLQSPASTSNFILPKKFDPLIPSFVFLPLSFPNSQKVDPPINFHKIHRWTGLTHILVLTPISISDPFHSGPVSYSTTMDLTTTKNLLSSFAIAFRNTKCKLPVFVPAGQLVNSLYAGYMCIFNQGNDRSHGNHVELKFNTTFTRDVPSGCSHLAGLTSLFLQKLELTQSLFDPKNESFDLNGISEPKISVAALFSYELQNWDDDDWRRLDDDDDDDDDNGGGGGGGGGSSINNIKPLESTGPPFEEDLFLQDLERENANVFGKRKVAQLNEFSESNQNLKLSRIASLVPNIPFGPQKDPLKSVILTAFFPSSPRDTYLDDDVFTEIDAGRAQIWFLKCKFSSETPPHALLATILEDSISSWVRDRSNSKSSKTGENKLFNGNNTKRSNVPKFSGTLRALESHIFDTGRSTRLNLGGVTIVDTVEIDNFIQGLFDSSRNIDNSLLHSPVGSSCGVSLILTPELSRNLRYATTFPYKSFLWNFLEYLLETVSPTSKFQHCSSLMGSLKILWAEVLKHIRLYWERGDAIPNINLNTLNDKCFSKNPVFLDQRNTTSVYDVVEKNYMSNIGIDMSSNLIHQKLCMINCCTSRLQKIQKENSKLSISSIFSKTSLPSNSSMSSSFNSLNKHNKNVFVSMNEQKQKNTEGKNNCIIPLDGYDDPNSVDPSEPNGGIENSKMANVSTSVENMQSPNADLSFFVPEEDDEPFLTNVSVSPLGIPQNAENAHRSVLQHRPSPSSFSHGQSFSPTHSLFSDHSDPNIHSSSLTESFIQLNYSSSMESSSGFEFSGRSPRADNKISGKGESKEGDECFEVKDENMREGHLYVFEGHILLKTGEPMWVPAIQDNGFMTEDMIREQEEYFEKLGNSEEAVKKRAQLQSAHLKSDMEAFKAANPHATFEDFVRWHSPRDWIPNNSGDINSGNLSPRMAREENFWKELWKNARRIPASRQRPLFNHNREGEKALRFLEQLSMQELFAQVLPTIFLIAYDTLVSHTVAKCIKPVALGLSSLAQELMSLHWSELRSESLAYEKIIESFRENELMLGKAISLLRKFPNQFNLVERILKNPETRVEKGDEREVVYKLFASGASLNGAFPHPTTREFILETAKKNDPLISRVVPARMYVLLSENGMRLVEMGGKA